MTPPSESLPSTGNGTEEARERRHWRAFWDSVPGWAKASIMALAGLSIGGASATGIIGGEKNDSKLSDRVLVVETKLDGMGKQLDRIEGKLDRRSR